MKKVIALIAGAGLASSMALAGDSALSKMHPNELEGVDVLGANSEKIGDVDEIVIDRNQKRMAVLGLDDSTREVVVPLERLQLSHNGKKLSSTFTKAELESLPDYDPGDMESADE